MSIQNLETNSSNPINISCSCFACIPPSEMIFGNSNRVIDFSFYPGTVIDFANATVENLPSEPSSDTASNIGSGQGDVFASKVGADFQFKSLDEGGLVSITQTATDITITGNHDSLNNLTNVAITSPSSSQILTYNGTDWVNQAVPSPVLTPNTAVITNRSGALISAATTATQISYLDTATSNIQTQINNLSASISTIVSAPYSATVNALSNLSTPSVTDSRYIQIGSNVQCQVNFNSTVNAATTCSFTVSIPVTTASYQGSGLCTDSLLQMSGSGVFASSDQFLTFTCTQLPTGGSTNISVSFMYQT